MSVSIYPILSNCQLELHQLRQRFIADRESKIATISISYTDGVPRTLTGKAEVLVCMVIEFQL